METLSDRVILLKSSPYGERNLILQGISENHGRVHVAARNAIQSRRFGGGTQFLAVGKWGWKQKPEAELGHLESIEVIRDFSGLANDYDRFRSASFMAECLLKLQISGQPSSDLFRLFSNALVALEEAEESLWPIVPRVFTLKLLQWFGSSPHLTHCQECQRPLQDLQSLDEQAPIWFTVERSQWMCAHHREQRTAQELGLLYPSTVQAIAQMVYGLNAPTRANVREEMASRSPDTDWFPIALHWLKYHVPGMDVEFKSGPS
jgi:DNA repair protein RecO